MVEKLFPDPLLQNQNGAYLWINSLKSFIPFVFILCQIGGYLNAMNEENETKLQTTCF